MNLDPDDRRIRDEMAHHLEELQRRLEEDGFTPEQARAEATRRFGDPDRIQRRTRSAATVTGRWARVAIAARMDATFALRQLIRRPLVTALTLTTLVVGVAATAVVYSVVDAVVLQPVPVDRPDGLVHVGQLSPQGRPYSISEPNFVDFRLRQRSFEDMAAMGFANPILRTTGDAEAVEAMTVSHSFFPLLGIVPTEGRDFLPEEDTFGGSTAVALLSEGAWTRRFGADPTVVGTTIEVDGTPHQIVGVVPSDRAWPGVELFTPLAPNPDEYRDDQRIEAIGRLLPGVTVSDAQADMSDIAAQLSVEYPDSNDRWGARATPIREWLIGSRLTRLGGFLLGAVGLFLLMACVSVSNLLLARATARVEEMGVRSALGAGRSRIAGQLVAEGALLAFAGAGLAVLLAPFGLRLVQRVGPADVARLSDAAIDGKVLAVAVSAAVVTTLVAGMAPALLLLKGDVFSSLRAGGRSGAGPSPRMRSGLVVVQFATALTVVLGASLLGRSFLALQEVELGFEPDGLVRFSVRLPNDRFDSDSRADFLSLLQDELESVPGVVAMGATHAAPYSRWRPSNFVARSDQEPDRQEDFLNVSWRGVTDDYFTAAGIQLLAGRTFGPQDRPNRESPALNPPVMIDQTLARMLWPNGEDPVGRLVTWFLPGGRQCEIVGVVAAARDERLDADPRPRIYRPLAYAGWDQPSVIVRTEGSPADLIPTLRRAVVAFDPSVPAIDPTPVTQDVRTSVAWPRFTMQVLGVFGIIALILAAMGIYGVTAFSVSRRRREIGVRVALGAEPEGVARMVVRRAMRLAVVGIGIGLVVSLGITGLLDTLLYDVSTTDPLTFVAVPALLIAVAAAAAWLPARRASRLDPRSALVSE